MESWGMEKTLHEKKGVFLLSQLVNHIQIQYLQMSNEYWKSPAAGISDKRSQLWTDLSSSIKQG